MPYQHRQDLPQSVQTHLPKHAQEIYLAAFNHAWQEYQNPEDRQGDDTLEEVAHKVAWAAVKKKYKKSGEQWVAK